MATSYSPRPLTHYAILSIAGGVVTFILKLGAWRLTGSVGLLSDAIESVVNIAAAALAYASLVVAARPADEDHTYGHTKVEYFAGGMEGALIILAALGIGWSAVEHLILPESLTQIGLGLSVSVVASVLNFGVAGILLRVGRKHHSVTLVADGKHLMTDVWTSACVVAGVGLVSATGWNRIDPLLGLAVAVHIIVTGVKLIHEALLGLMDTGLPENELVKIREVFAKYFVAHGVEYHALRTRQAGAWRFMAVHVLVPGEWTVARAHELVEQIEEEIRQKVERINVTTHLEPLEDPTSWDDVDLERKDRSAPAPKDLSKTEAGVAD